MIQKRIKLLNFINRLLDWGLIVAAYFVSTYIRFVSMYTRPNLDKGWNASYIAAIAVFAVAMVLCYTASGLYGNYRYSARSSRNEFLKIFALNTIGVIVIWGILYLTRYADFSRFAMVLFLLFSTLFVCIKRMLLKLFQK